MPLENSKGKSPWEIEIARAYAPDELKQKEHMPLIN